MEGSDVQISRTVLLKEMANPCNTENFKMPHPLLIVSQSDYLIQIVNTNPYTQWQTVQIQISWLLKPTYLDLHCITKTRLFKYIENFTSENWKFSDKKLWYFFIFLLKNIDCGYSLEPPRRGGSNEYPQYMFLSRNKKNNVYPCKPQFYYIKVGFKGVKII